LRLIESGALFRLVDPYCRLSIEPALYEKMAALALLFYSSYSFIRGTNFGS
jgi:hypothetical protein